MLLITYKQHNIQILCSMFWFTIRFFCVYNIKCGSGCGNHIGTRHVHYLYIIVHSIKSILFFKLFVVLIFSRTILQTLPTFYHHFFWPLPLLESVFENMKSGCFTTDITKSQYIICANNLV